jgi:hypothetical protein
MNLNEAFEQLHNNLKLDPDELAAARDLHNRLGDHLVACGIAKRTRLQGSLARGTMRAPLKDIDKIIELSDDIAAELDRPGGPALAMARIAASLASFEEACTVDFGTHALQITVAGFTFTFDAVPAIHSEDCAPPLLRIANTDDDAWEASNAYRLIETIAERNQKLDGVFIHQVRMVKQAAAACDLDIPGIHIEAFAYQALHKKHTHPTAVGLVFTKAAEMLAGDYNDPTGEDQISDRLGPNEKERARDGFADLADRAERAVEAASTGDERKALGIWAEVFGDPFPEPESYADFLKSLSFGCGVDKAGQPTAEDAATRTRAWAPQRL